MKKNSIQSNKVCEKKLCQKFDDREKIAIHACMHEKRETNKFCWVERDFILLLHYPDWIFCVFIEMDGTFRFAKVEMKHKHILKH